MNSDPLATTTTDWTQARCPACEGQRLLFEHGQMMCENEDCRSASPADVSARKGVNEPMTAYMTRIMEAWAKDLKDQGLLSRD